MTLGPLCLYVGTSEPAHLARTTIPLLIPHHRLTRLHGALPRSPWRGHWALDSGGFGHLRKHGTWTISPERYVADVRRFDVEIGNLGWAAPQDWMCEPDVIAATGLSVLEHQRRTVANFVRLRELWRDQTDDESPIMPVLQGDPDAHAPRSYLDHWDMYGAAGVELTHSPLIGLGSVCRRQATEAIGELVAALQDRDGDRELPLHGFGCKSLGVVRYGHMLTSADSMAWSLHARLNRIKYAGCRAEHAVCSSCLDYALHWRRRVIGQADQAFREIHGYNFVRTEQVVDEPGSLG